MKKLMFRCLFICLLLGIGSQQVLASANSPSIFIDGTLLREASGTISETGRTLAPLRSVFEAMGASVTYDSASRSITAVKGDSLILLSVDSKVATVNGKAVTLDAPAQIINGRTMVPLRFVAMAMGATVNWDADNRVVSISTKVEGSQLPNRGDAGTYSRKFEWSSSGYDWWITLEIDKDHYQYFKNRPRLNTRDYSLYVSDPADDLYMAQLISTFRDIKEKNGLNDAQTVQSVVAFVQGLEYRADAASTGFDEYPKYPLETLVEKGGDCEDSSILLASLLREMGYGTVLLNPPGHMAVGVRGSDTLPGTYYMVDGIRYYYVETTSPNWPIGQIPDAHKDDRVVVLKLDPKPLISFRFQTEGETIYTTVRNDGTSPAANIFVYAYLDAGNGMVYREAYSQAQTIPARGEAILPVRLTMPSGVNTRLVIQVISEGRAVSEYQSEWFWLP